MNQTSVERRHQIAVLLLDSREYHGLHKEGKELLKTKKYFVKNPLFFKD
jgi:hypothetical protein